MTICDAKSMEAKYTNIRETRVRRVLHFSCLSNDRSIEKTEGEVVFPLVTAVSWHTQQTHISIPSPCDRHRPPLHPSMMDHRDGRESGCFVGTYEKRSLARKSNHEPLFAQTPSSQGRCIQQRATQALRLQISQRTKRTEFVDAVSESSVSVVDVGCFGYMLACGAEKPATASLEKQP
jgi:hypothetical protein